MSGGIENIFFKNCTVHSERGATLKTSLSRGGYIKNVFFENIFLNETDNLIVIQTDYGLESSKLRQTAPVIDNINYYNLYGSGHHAGSLVCTSSIPCMNVNMTNIQFKAKDGFKCKEIYGKVVDVSPKMCYGN